MIVRQKQARRGISILEVLIALAIFLLSLVAISQLMDQGADLAVQLDERTHASMLAQSKLAELIAGSEPLEGHGDTPIDGEPDWYWSLAADADSIPNLYHVVVTVSKETRRGKIEVSFHQYVVNPTSRGSTDSSTTTTEDQTATPNPAGGTQ